MPLKGYDGLAERIFEKIKQVSISNPPTDKWDSLVRELAREIALELNEASFPRLKLFDLRKKVYAYADNLPRASIVSTQGITHEVFKYLAERYDEAKKPW